MVASIRVLLYYNSVNRLFEILNKINITPNVRENVSMADYTTFKCGGMAEVFIEPNNSSEILAIQKFAKDENIPLFILGGGANLLVSDKGIPGITLYLGKMDKINMVDNVIEVESGLCVNSVAEFAERNSLSGLEFIYGMPGSIGGAVWMNARCYNDEISNHFLWAEYITKDGEIKIKNKNPQEWDYKISPFQEKDIIITKVALELNKGNRVNIQNEMNKNINDRQEKGHFNYPCAGSVFKNNRLFGVPSGKLIEDAGLKGVKKGNAQISTFHGNIIVNLGGALSSDINYLIDLTINTVREKTGFELEPEVIKVGNWE